ncbi:hypothetical protein ZYGR_0AK01070 [Zygosaccharomyces rouxii]|uniref:Conserved oligomeric Golgi complex subunit 6 n=1 Tax=Zygosaccharomyces rouxii TaxID=4956 RepID=A0A1Q3ADA9_ZYGRO|nr:hypothetical protein ZYGR_0AK01070 [Zygosaccharomyces rouxii]
MDFLEYHALAALEAPSESSKELPEPSSMLNLSSFPTSSTEENAFKLPDLISGTGGNNYNNNNDNGSSKDEETRNLYDKMTHYANLSMKKLNIDDARVPTMPTREPTNSRFVEPTRAKLSLPDSFNKKNKPTDATDLVLSKKLSKVLNDYSLSNYQSRSQLRKSLQSLERNRDKLNIDEKRLINPGYLGILERKSLRSDLENELLKDHLTVLEEFRPIVRRINRWSNSVNNIKEAGKQLVEETELDQANEDDSVTDRVNQLRADAKSLELKKKLLIALKDQFTLNQLEDDIIANGEVDLEFFKIVNKALQIKERATLLLALPSSRAGSSLITQTNQTLGFVNKKVFNHLVDFLHNYESNSQLLGERSFDPDDKNFILFQKSLIYLSNDLEHFNEFLKRVTSVRSKSVLDEFLSQFDFNPKDSKPILLSAQDPLRYIGDVLANIHSSIANEADFVKSLFKFQLDDSTITIPQFNKEFLQGLDVKLLNETVQSLANSCRIRVEQIVNFEEDPVLNLEIARLLNLYQLMFERKGIRRNSALIDNLHRLECSARDRIPEYYTKFLKELESLPVEPSDDLLPPDWLSEYIGKIVDLFEVYQQGNTEESHKVLDLTFLQKVVENPIKDILIKRIQTAFPLAKKNETSRFSSLTMQINCLDLIKTRFQPFATTVFAQDDQVSSIFQMIEDRLNSLVTQLLELQQKLLFENTGMGLYYNLFNMIFPVSSVQDELDYDMYLSLCENPLMDLSTIENNVHEKLNTYIPQALTDVQENMLFKLASPTIADHICETCFATLSLFYVTFRKVLMHLYPEQKDIVQRFLNFSEQEFNTLIGIDQGGLDQE